MTVRVIFPISFEIIFNLLRGIGHINSVGVISSQRETEILSEFSLGKAIRLHWKPKIRKQDIRFISHHEFIKCFFTTFSCSGSHIRPTSKKLVIHVTCKKDEAYPFLRLNHINFLIAQLLWLILILTFCGKYSPGLEVNTLPLDKFFKRRNAYSFRCSGRASSTSLIFFFLIAIFMDLQPRTAFKQNGYMILTSCRRPDFRWWLDWSSRSTDETALELTCNLVLIIISHYKFASITIIYYSHILSLNASSGLGTQLLLSLRDKIIWKSNTSL